VAAVSVLWAELDKKPRPKPKRASDTIGTLARVGVLLVIYGALAFTTTLWMLGYSGFEVGQP
jgi:hypothetical protein